MTELSTIQCFNRNAINEKCELVDERQAKPSQAKTRRKNQQNTRRKKRSQIGEQKVCARRCFHPFLNKLFITNWQAQWFSERTLIGSNDIFYKNRNDREFTE